MVTCGGQATIPMVAAVSRVAKVHYGEIVASISSKSAGPGTRANIDEFTETTCAAIEVLGGAEGQGHHRAEPGRAAADHARHGVHAERPRGAGRRSTSIAEMVAQRAGLRAGLPAEAAGAVRRIEAAPLNIPARASARAEDLGLPRSRRRRALPAGLCRQPGHHDQRPWPRRHDGAPTHRGRHRPRA